MDLITLAAARGMIDASKEKADEAIIIDMDEIAGAGKAEAVFMGAIQAYSTGYKAYNADLGVFIPEAIREKILANPQKPVWFKLNIGGEDVLSTGSTISTVGGTIFSASASFSVSFDIPDAGIYFIFGGFTWNSNGNIICGTLCMPVATD